jgi:hypothetical protein
MQNTTRRHGLKSSMLKLSLKIVGATTLAMAVATTQRPAVTLAASSGVQGPWNVVPSVCAVDLGNSYVYAAIPNIWSSNRHSGWGNDRQVVRYWTRLVTLSGAPIGNWAYGGQGTANDNSLALFPSLTKPWIGQPNVGIKWGPLGSWAGSVRLEYFVAWYNPTTMGVLGTATGIQFSYQGYAGSLTGFTLPNC